MSFCLVRPSISSDPSGPESKTQLLTLFSSATSFSFWGVAFVQMNEGSVQTLNPGNTYHVPPGHTLEVNGDIPCVMIEFSQDTAEVVAKVEESK